jgi:DNA-binding NtrC family response regulator
MEKAERTILFVDDDQNFLCSAEEALQNLGYRVIVKTDGQEALSVFREGIKVDVVITDYQMPGMNGLEFMSALRKKGLSMPMVMLSAYSDVETYFKALSLGAYEVTSKPISARELSAIVQAALSRPTSGAEGKAGFVRKNRT